MCVSVHKNAISFTKMKLDENSWNLIAGRWVTLTYFIIFGVFHE